MNNLQEVVRYVRSALDHKCVFVHMTAPQLETMLAGLEESQRELEKVTLERDNENWRAIWYEGHIEDASRSAAKWQQHYINLLEEHKAMKEALGWYADTDSHTVLPGAQLTDVEKDMGYKARKVLSTLKCID